MPTSRLPPSCLPACLPAPPQAAHLLTQATKSQCRARFSSYEACAQEGALPINAPLRHLELSLPGATGYTWQLAVVDQVFAVFTQRLAADRLAFTAPEELDALDACAQQLAQARGDAGCEQPGPRLCGLAACCCWVVAAGGCCLLLAACTALSAPPTDRSTNQPTKQTLSHPPARTKQVLVSYLVQHGGNAEVPRVADRLLERLLGAFPALQVGGGRPGGRVHHSSAQEGCMLPHALILPSCVALRACSPCCPPSQFKPDVLAAMFSAADEEEAAARQVRRGCHLEQAGSLRWRWCHWHP